MRDENFLFDFERLTVYQKGVAFSNAIFKATSEYKPQVQSSLGDHLRRSALSICNNIAEGSGKSGRAKVQFYGYALDSARECIPMITISLMQNQLQQEQCKALRSACIEITSMLFSLIQSAKN